MKKVSIGIIGCGVIGPVHAASAVLDERSEVRWACDLDIDKARDRIEARKYTADYRDLLKDPDVDLVAVCTQHPNHPRLAIDALEAGKHVVCEKPLGSHPDQVTALVKAARKAEEKGLVAAGIFQHRYRPLIKRLHELFTGGDFGKVTDAEMNFACTRTAEYYAADPWRGSWDQEGGGLMLNQAIHTLDILLALAGKAGTVSSMVERRWLDCIEVEDFAEGTICLASGTEVPFRCVNSEDGGWESTVTITGEYGRVVIGSGNQLKKVDHRNPTLAAELRALDAAKAEEIKLPAKACYGIHHVAQYQDIISAILAGRKPMIRIEDSAATTQTVLAMYHSTALGGEPVKPGASGYTQPVLKKVDAA